MNQIQKTLEIIQKKLPNVKAIYLFGSYDTPFKNKESDIDIAIIASSPINAVERWQVAEEIARFLKKDVDLIDLKDASTVMRFQIITSGKRLFCNDPFFCDMFETTAYSMYEKLNEERYELLEDIKKRGSIFNG